MQGARGTWRAKGNILSQNNCKVTEDNQKRLDSETGSDESGAAGSEGTPNAPRAEASGPESPKPESSKTEAPSAAEKPAATPTAPETAEATKTPAKPAVPTPPARPAVPRKPKGPQKTPYSGPLVDALNERFAGDLVESYTFVGIRHFVIQKNRLTELMGFLRRNDVEPFDFLSDETATHWPQEEEFELVYVLFSFETKQRIIVKTRTREWETIESLVAIWPGANWLEREIHDMYGVRFANHPNLKRILLPEDWVGYPLRKDYDMRLQDVEWVRKHLGIDSGQRFYVGEAKHDDT